MKADSPRASREWLRWPVASLRAYLVAVIVVATVPLGALTSWLMGQEVASSREQLSASLQRAASALALTVERELLSSVDALGMLAYADALQADDLAGFHRMLTSLPRVRPTWSRVYLTDLRGQVLLGSDARQGRPAVPPLPPRELQQLTRTGRPVISGLVGTGGAGARPLSSTRIDVPVLVDGQTRYVLVAEISTDTWQALLTNASAPPDGFVTLFDGQDQILARSLHPERFVGRLLPDQNRQEMRRKATGFQRVEMMEGGATYAAWRRMDLSGWGVAVGVAAQPLDKAHVKAISAAAGAGLMSLLAGLAMALFVARRVSGPLASLAANGPGSVPGQITVREIALLRDALASAEHQREQARERLEAKAAEFEALFTTSPIGLSITQDPQARVVLRNPAKLAMFNLKPGQPSAARLLQQGQELPEERHPLQRAARGETLWNQELEVRHADGRTLKLLAHAVPLLDAAGRPRGAIATFVDITERMQAQERLVQAERRLRESQHLVELAQEAGDVGFFDHVLAADAVTCTSGLARLLGLQGQEFTTSWAGWMTHVDAEDAPLLERHIHHAWGERHEQVTFKFRTRAHTDEGPRWLSSRVMVMYDEAGRPMRMIGVMVDITAQQLVEQERARLIAQEQKARVEAENANRAKDEFLAMLGHELRNPLGAISAAVEVLNRSRIQDPEAQARVRQIITRQTRLLARLMDDLLDVARVITGKIMLSRQPVNLGTMVQRLVNTLGMAGTLHEHPTSVNARDVWVQADAMRLEQIVNNLLTNAAKYSGPGQPIEVLVDRVGGQARLRVVDHGLGIPDTLLPRIFDLFVQGERTLDRRQGGLGIGLTLVKRLVELHEGRIDVTTSSQGSTFTVELPVCPAPEDVPDQDIPGDAPARRMVVVEDNEDALEALRIMLELQGHSVWLAANGLDGLARLLQVRPEVALVDIGLPGLTGYEVAQRARSEGYAGRLIAISGYGQQRDIQKALDAGFDAYLVKPVDPAQLERMLAEMGAGTGRPAASGPRPPAGEFTAPTTAEP